MDSKLDLDLCAREPIHIPGAIQPYGALLCLSEPDLIIQQASQSCADVLGRAPAQLLGRPLSDLFGAALAPLQADLPAQALRDLNPLELELVSGPGPGAAGRYEVTAHRSQGLLLLEFEHAPPDPGRHGASFSRLVSRFTAQLQGTTTFETAAAVATEQIAEISGFDRVMIYRFDDHWDGEVVAEARRADLLPYLGLRFPASDIPSQARRLFTLNRLRLIADAAYQPSPILPGDHPRTGQPLDLSHALLRSASPIHLEYLHNMGVRATLTISILVEGALWGLIACHHRAPRCLPYQIRAACEFLGQIFSFHLSTIGAREHGVHRARLQQVHDRIAATLRDHDLFTALQREQDALLHLTGAGGAAVALHDQLVLFGATPTRPQTQQLIDWLRSRPGAQPELLSTRCLSALHPAAEAFKDHAAGLLALPLLQGGAGWILWFRPELIQTVSWAGDPHKPMQPADSGRLHPRRSFALWQEILSRHAAPFQPWEVAAAVDIRHALLSRAAEDEKRATKEANAQLRAAQQRLVAAARQAGMAEIATGILHNVGNALNSVNVSATTILEQIKGSRLLSLGRATALLAEHPNDLPRYIEHDPRGQQLPGFLIKLAAALLAEREAALAELGGLVEGVDHIREIVRTQQSYAGSYSIVENVRIGEVVEDAVRMSSASLLRHGVQVARAFEDGPPLSLDKHKVLQILINLISNAKYAMDDTPPEDRVMTLRTHSSQAAVRVSVEDRGCGVPTENLTRIFSHGFTTRSGGHGFGLHASVLLAQEMKGALTVFSRGAGQGATFTLELPRL